MRIYYALVQLLVTRGNELLQKCNVVKNADNALSKSYLVITVRTADVLVEFFNLAAHVVGVLTQRVHNVLRLFEHGRLGRQFVFDDADFGEATRNFDTLLAQIATESSLVNYATQNRL